MKKLTPHRTVIAPTLDGLADQAAASLRQRRFREAAELYKNLIRQDPRPEWNERLADAYAGRASDLAAKGMYKEAAIVLENTVAPGRTIREPLLYISCLIHQGQFEKARRAALASIAGAAAADAARLRTYAAVLALAAATPEPTSAAGEDWAEQSNAARAALHAWVQGSAPDEVDGLLGRISLRSSFGPLRLILKVMIAPAGNAEKARTLLAMIPPDSMFAGPCAAAEAVLADGRDLLDRWSRLRPKQQQFVGEVRGWPAASTTLLNQLLDAERRGPASLFDFLIRRPLCLPEPDVRAACLNLLPAVPGRVHEFQKRFGALGTLDHHRILALAAEARADWEAAPSHWWLVIAALQAEGTPDARLEQAVVFRHLAELAQRHPEFWDDERIPEHQDPVAEYLQCSVDADPDFLPGTVQLLERHRSEGDLQRWQEAAQRAAAQFPTNAAVLSQAVDAAVARNAYKQAVVLARQVLQVDPINQPVRQRMIELQLAYARRQMRSGRADLADKALAEAAEWERPDQPSGPLRIGRALVRVAAEPGTDPGPVLRAAVQEAGGNAVAWFNLMIEASLMGVSEQRLRPVQADLLAAQRSEPDHAMILALVSLLGQKEIRDTRKRLASVLRQTRDFLSKGSRITWTTAEFQTIAELLTDLREFAALFNYTRNALARSDDAVVQFYHLVARTGGNNRRLGPRAQDQLYAMLEDPATRRNFALFHRVQRFLFGDRGGKPTGKRARDSEMPDALDDHDMAELLASIPTQMPKPDAKEMRSLVNEVGRDLAIDMLAIEMAGSPIAELLSADQVRQLCGAIIAHALQSGSPRTQQAQRR